ncbi:Response regulator of zinc sigma-54-dependent two-component system [hydrothermal vent metagenome]|uniref:Response regulator of zinc sigma-54-dependent two-component system n=1 Tax=hydrothermal vent metagenome TaxID=652676 RepID=A0A3B0UEB9_9ZZZZ
MQLEGLKIGLIEDSPIMGASLEQALSLEGADVIWWSSGSEGLSALPHANRDIIICDIRLPDMSGEQIFDQARHYRSVVPFLFMTAYGDVEQAVSMLKNGAGDYVTKPFELEDLFQRISSLVPTRELRQARGVLGPSAAMLEIESTLKRVSATPMPVLLTGQTGVGKEVCAHFVHELSAEDAAPFMAINCATIPQSATEIELFGRDQARLHRGYAEKAQKGTLYLDGIGDLALSLQPKLLRLLEDETFFHFGDPTPVHFHARIICSSIVDIKTLLETDRFRQDLYYRINTVSIYIPPLRERVDDIIWLAERFLLDAAALSGGEPKQLSAGAQERLMDHSWPGNARELRNSIERAHSLARNHYILPEDLFAKDPGDHSFDYKIAKLSVVRDAAEKRQIELALKARGGNVSQAAQTLGISRTTMWEKMLKHAIKGQTKE